MHSGITAGGNWIIDRIKFVDAYPEPGHLGTILSTEPSANGGCPYNVLVDLARLGTGLPLQGIGVIGDDDAGAHILADCRANGIDTSLLSRRVGMTTSYTDVITVQSTAARTFFHARAANALLDIDDFDIDRITGRICLVGYLLLLDRLDQPDKKYGTRAARLLARLKDAGIETAIDVVSEQGERFTRIVTPALKHTDYLIFNEIEAGKVLGTPLRREDGRIHEAEVMDAALALLKLGVGKMAVIHYPEGATAVVRKGKSVARHSVRALALPPGFIKGTVGAGDAFCAGCLHAIYNGAPLRDVLEFGTGVASASLSHATASMGITSLKQVKTLMKRYGRTTP